MDRDESGYTFVDVTTPAGKAWYLAWAKRRTKEVYQPIEELPK